MDKVVHALLRLLEMNAYKLFTLELPEQHDNNSKWMLGGLDTSTHSIYFYFNFKGL